jgi:polysaccharide export outer membrane protein
LAVAAFTAAPFAGAAPVPASSPPGKQPASDYKIGPSDLIAISVYRAPDLQMNVRVSERGTILMPQLGEVEVAGLTPSQTADRIAAALRASGILLQPSVNVLVTEYRSKTVAVLGAVARPGEIPLDRPGLTIADVLARAGANFTSDAMLVSVRGTEDGKPVREEFRIADLISGGRDRPVRAGEQIFMQDAPTFFISGQVKQAGAYPVSPGLTVGQAVALGGGLTPRGTMSRVSVTRKDSSGLPVKVNSVKAETPVVPGDLISVGTRWF